MRLVNIILYSFLLEFSGCTFSQTNLECNIDVEKNYVFFDDCYNGLLINELEIRDSVISLYPHKYKKVSQIELLANDSTINQKEDVKVYFEKKTKNFTWKIYQCENFEPYKCFSDSNNYEIKDTVHLFKPNTWYLFSFHNPRFVVFVFSDKAGKISFTKKHLNPNF